MISSLLDGTSSVRHFVRHRGSEDDSISSPTISSAGNDALGLGIFAGANPGRANLEDRHMPGRSGDKRERKSSQRDRDGNEKEKEGISAVLAKLNKPLQRRTSGSRGKDSNVVFTTSSHQKRDSTSSIIADLAANARRKGKEGGAQLATLLEASQSMASFFTESSKSPPHPAVHARFASSNTDRVVTDAPLDLETGTKYASPPLSSSQPASSARFFNGAPDDLDQGIASAVMNAFGPVKAHTATGPIKQTRESKEKNARELLMLLREPDNRKCADCHEPGDSA